MRGTPRIANRLLRRVRDFAEVEGTGVIDIEIANHALGRMRVDALGLDPMDRLYLETMIDKFGGGPVGHGTMRPAPSAQGAPRGARCAGSRSSRDGARRFRQRSAYRRPCEPPMVGRTGAKASVQTMPSNM